WSLPTMTRDTADTYSEVIIRGGPNVVAVSLSVNQKPGSSFTSTWAPSGSGAIPNGGLLPWFTFGSYTTNAAAEAAWSPAMYQQAGFDSGQDEGSLTCPDTLTCILTSTQSPSYVNWAIDQLDQSNTGLHAILFVFSDTIPGFAAYYQARIIANAATTSGGTSSNSTTVTLDQPLPGVGYNSYHLWALSAGGNVVWRRYKVMNADIAARMQQFFPYPFAYSWGNGTPSAGAFLTTSPVFTVGHTSRWVGQGILAPPITPPTYTSSGGYPAVIDPDAGTISFVSPTAIWDGFTSTIIPPVDVQAFIPVANGVLEVFAPAASYFTGTAALIEGIYRIKVITCRDWTDYSNTQNMQAYANELLQSMCDVVLEGSTSYLGLATAFLSPAQAVQITGSSYTTGWEGGGISNPQIVSGGSGYSGTMTYTITGSGAGGVLSSIVTGGVITSVWVSTRGSGYTGAVTVSVSGSGGGSGASITLQSEALPVASMDVRFQPGPGGTSYVSTLHLSNRRARYTSEIFVRPAMRGATWGAGVGYAAAQGMSQILGNTDFSSGAMGAFNEAAAGNPGQAAIPEIASLGQTPAEQTRAKQRADQDFERNLLESSGSGDSDDNPPTVKQQQRERAISMQGDREAAAARATPEPVNESFEKFAKRTKAAPPAPPPAPNQIPTDEAMEVARNWPKDQADLEQSRRKQPPAPNNPYAE
ncbi:MAG: hypothetical protein ACXVB2_17480, partial [Isosphaeraceae bacterium]